MQHITRGKILAQLRVSIFFFLTLLGVSQALLANKLSWLAFGDLRGHFASCGCNPKTDRGGVARIATLIKRDKLIFSHTKVFDLGNNYKSGKHVDQRKIKYINKALKTLAPDASLFNQTEFLIAEKLHYSHSYVLSNRKNILQKKSYLKDSISDDQMIVLGYTWSATLSNKLEKWDLNLQKKWKKILAKHPKKEKILLFSGTDASLKKIVRTKLFKLIISSHKTTLGDPSEQKPNTDKDALLRLSDTIQSVRMVPLSGTGVLRGGTLAQHKPLNLEESLGARNKATTRLEKLDNTFLFSKAQHKIFMQDYSLVWLTKDYEVGSPLSFLKEEYNQEKTVEFESKRIKRKNELKNSPYIGAQVCLGCHKEAYKVWQKSRHAHAYETLEKVKKNFDAECVSCHVVGLKEKGGFVSKQDSPHLKGVQCENCHGPRREHIKNPQKKVLGHKITACSSCHHAPHTPDFKQEHYWPKIAHGFKKQDQ